MGEREGRERGERGAREREGRERERERERKREGRERERVRDHATLQINLKMQS